MNIFNNFAVMSYSFHGLKNVGAMNLFGYLETVRYRYNLQTADIWNGFIESYEDQYIELVKQNIEERGLTVTNFCCDCAEIWDNDPEQRAKNEKMAWDCLKFAKAIKAKTIRIDAGVREDVFTEENLAYVANKYKEYCEYAATFGAKLGTENHWGASTNYTELKKLYAAVTCENFGLLLHFGNWTNTPDIKPEDFDKYDLDWVNKAMHMHLDFEHSARAQDIIPPFLKAGYSGCWTVESHKSTNEYNNVAYQLANLKRVVAPLNYSGEWGPEGPPSYLAKK